MKKQENEIEKFTPELLSSYSNAIFSEMVSQCGRIENIENLFPLNIVQTDGLTIEKMANAIGNFDKICIVGITTHV